MRKIVRYFRRWRYRRLYLRLFKLYAGKSDFADVAGREAAAAFQWITGYEWEEMVSR